MKQLNLGRVRMGGRGMRERPWGGIREGERKWAGMRERERLRDEGCG